MTSEFPAALVADGLELRRAGRAVLRGAHLRVPERGATAVLGASGSGKSTLLRCLVRLERPDAGSVSLFGQDIAELQPCELRRRVALVPQSPVMLPGTVRDNLAYNLDRLDATRASRALARVGLGDGLLHRPAGELSGGETLRVGIARAVVREPEMLLLDEPTAALDRSAAEAIGAMVGSVASGGMPVVVATHDRALVRAVARHVVLLEDGRTSVVEALSGGAGGDRPARRLRRVDGHRRADQPATAAQAGAGVGGSGGARRRAARGGRPADRCGVRREGPCGGLRGGDVHGRDVDGGPPDGRGAQCPRSRRRGDRARRRGRAHTAPGLRGVRRRAP